MATRKLHPLLLFILILPLFASAQFDEFGTFIGVSGYSGDLSERAIEPLEINFAAGFYARKNLTKRMALKAFGYRGFISGNDAHSTVESGLWVRNLRFESEIYEIGGQLEFSLFRFEKDVYQGSPYVFVGVSAFYFNPTAELDGKTYELNRFKTEGVEYSLFQPAIPFGAGMKMSVNKHGTLGFEFGLRKTFTDYLDDVSDTYANFEHEEGLNAGERSLKLRLAYRTPEVKPDAPMVPGVGQQRGNPDRKDWFMYFGLTLGIYLND